MYCYKISRSTVRNLSIMKGKGCQMSTLLIQKQLVRGWLTSQCGLLLMRFFRRYRNRNNTLHYSYSETAGGRRMNRSVCKLIIWFLRRWRNRNNPLHYSYSETAGGRRMNRSVCILIIWFLRWCRNRNDKLHLSHTKGFSPVCIRWWRSKSLFCRNCFSHRSHLYLAGLGTCEYKEV